MNYQTGDLKSLINLLSKEYGWPDFDTTMKSHSASNDTFINMLTSDVLKINQSIIQESIKMKSECNATFTFFNLALNDLRIPTISRTNQGLRQFSKGYWAKDVTARFNSFYDAWYLEALNEKEDRYRLFAKLISEKLFRTTVLDTDLHNGGNYNCPMKAIECPHRCELCSNIANVNDLINNNEKRGIKCMFADYLNSKEFMTTMSRKIKKEP